MGHISFDISPLSDNTWQVELIFLQVSQYCATRAERTSIWNIYNILILSKLYLSTKIHQNIESSTNIFLLFGFVAKITWGVAATGPTMDSAFRLYSCVIVNLIDLAVKTAQQLFQSVIEKVFLCDTSDLGQSLILISEPIFMKRRIFELGEIARH